MRPRPCWKQSHKATSTASMSSRSPVSRAALSIQLFGASRMLVTSNPGGKTIAWRSERSVRCASTTRSLNRDRRPLRQHCSAIERWGVAVGHRPEPLVRLAPKEIPSCRPTENCGRTGGSFTSSARSFPNDCERIGGASGKRNSSSGVNSRQVESAALADADGFGAPKSRVNVGCCLAPAPSAGGGLAQDVRHGFRLIGRAPGLALAACTSLAIGIGGTTAAFTMLDAALLRPWPYPDADRLMVVSTNLGRYFSPPAFRRLSDRHDGLDHLTAAEAHGFLMNFGGQAVLVNGHRVSAEVVALLGLDGPLHPDAGRAFIPSEFAPDSDPSSRSVTVCGRRSMHRPTILSVRLLLPTANPCASSPCSHGSSISFPTRICSSH
jgi:hypothetical protein